MTRILVEIAAGELIDKITILEIKLTRINDAEKLAHVRREYDVLMDAYRRCVVETPELRAKIAQLKELNQALWDIEDTIRGLERSGDFGERFVLVARSVYRTNDQRAATKRDINQMLHSGLTEEKSYTEY